MIWPEPGQADLARRRGGPDAALSVWVRQHRRLAGVQHLTRTSSLGEVSYSQLGMEFSAVSSDP